MAGRLECPAVSSPLMDIKPVRQFALSAAVVLACVAILIAVARRSAGTPPGPVGPLTRMSTVERADIQVRVRETGIIQASEQVQVKSALSGRVVALKAREGDRVRRGGALAIVEPDLAQAQAFVDLVNSVRMSKQALDESRRDFAADDHLFQSGLLPEATYLDSKARVVTSEQVYQAAQRKYRLLQNSGIRVNKEDGTVQTSVVRAPIDGVILSRAVAVGETVVSGVGPLNAGTVLFTIAGSGAVRVKTAVPELHIGKVAVGQEATITSDAYPGLVIPARVAWIAPAIRVDERARVFDVELEPNGKHPQLRNGMTVNVDIAGVRRKGVPTLPVEAIFESGDEQFVYLYRNAAASPTAGQKRVSVAQSFVKRPVRTGLSDGNRIEVLSGLMPGERVAVDPPSRTAGTPR